MILMAERSSRDEHHKGIKPDNRAAEEYTKLFMIFRLMEANSSNARKNHHQRLQQFSLRALMEIEFNINSLTDS